MVTAVTKGVTRKEATFYWDRSLTSTPVLTFLIHTVSKSALNVPDEPLHTNLYMIGWLKSSSGLMNQSGCFIAVLLSLGE